MKINALGEYKKLIFVLIFVAYEKNTCSKLSKLKKCLLVEKHGFEDSKLLSITQYLRKLMQRSINEEKQHLSPYWISIMIISILLKSIWNEIYLYCSNMSVYPFTRTNRIQFHKIKFDNFLNKTQHLNWLFHVLWL